MQLRKYQRRLLRGVGCGIAGLALLVLALPLWFPWVLRPLAQRVGADYGRFERMGYRRFALDGLSISNQAVLVRAERVEALVPSVWLWHRFFEKEPPARPVVLVNGWQVEGSPSPATPGPAATPYETARQVKGILDTLARWLPSAALSNGTIRAGGVVLNLPATRWMRGNFSAQVESPQVAQQATLRGNLANGPPYIFRVESGSLHLESDLRISLAAAALDLQASSLWRSNHIGLQAHFACQDVLPAKAALQAPELVIPAGWVGLKGYLDLRGSLAATWENGAFALDARTEALPAQPDTNATTQPIKVELHARGNTNMATVETLAVSLPWLTLNLSKGLNLHFAGPVLREPATVEMAADLAQQHWIPGKGRLSGHAELAPSGKKFPAVSFQFSGNHFAVSNIDVATLEMQGRLDWPWLQITQANAHLTDGSAVSVAGKLELQNKLVADGHAAISGPLARRWLPRGYSFQDCSATADFHGPWAALTNHGKLDITGFASPQLRPVRLQADWSGEPPNPSRVELHVSAGNSSLNCSANWAPFLAPTKIQLTRFSLQSNGVPCLESTQPARLSLRPNPAGVWRAQLDDLHWRGSAGELALQAAVDWPRAGNLRGSAKNLRASAFADFSTAIPNELVIHQLDAFAEWTNGPAKFSLELSASGFTKAEILSSQPPGQTDSRAPAISLQTVEVTLNGDQNGIVISNLNALSGASALATGRGFLPLSINPATAGRWIKFDDAKPLQLRVATGSEAVLWDALAARIGVALREPDLNVDISGTWRDLHGEIKFGARQIEFSSSKARLPVFEQLRIDLQFDRREARLQEGRLLIQGQPVSLSGTLPLGESFWKRVNQKKLPDWQMATARLQIEKAKLAAFVPLFPEWVSPQGELDLDVEIQPGARVQGQLTLQGARTRALPQVGPIRDIAAQIRFRDRALELKSISGNLGGSIVMIHGRADLPGTNWWSGGLPPFALTLRGTNVPLSREPGSIIRSDLDLSVAKTNRAPPLISGNARLRESYLLSDLTDLVPRESAAPSARPPYFSITDPLFADWGLAVSVTGSRFLTVNSTLFHGVVSANLKLNGTLQEPVALGDLKIDSGTVQFPFGSLGVQQGFVTLTSEDPYHPRLSLSAASRQFGYDVKMEASGTVNSPVIQFTSTPPLSSEQILLMVSAGELPQGGINLTPQQREQSLAMFLGRDMLTELGFADQTQQRLTIRSGENISELGVPSYEVEFKLSPRWSLVGERDQFDDYNAGVKWRIYSK